MLNLDVDLSACVFLLAMSSHLQTSLPMSSRKFTCGQVKEQVWGS